MTADSEIQVENYSPAVSGECVELERSCPQGQAYRMRFERASFHGRSESFNDWNIFVARHEGRVVGTLAAAYKDIEVAGLKSPAVYYYDLRVHPGMRGRGIAKSLIAQGAANARARNLRYGYTYCLNDNRATQHLVKLFGGSVVGTYGIFVWPVFRQLPVPGRVVQAPASAVHESMLDAEGEYDFYSHPLRGGRLQGHMASFLSARGGASLWSNAGIFSEVIERVPLAFRVAGGALKNWPLNKFKLPHVPSAGEQLRGCYAFDFHAQGEGAAREMMHAINNYALERGLDYCYVLVGSQAKWLSELRRAAPPFFSPLLSNCVLMRDFEKESTLRLQRAYIDIRDL